MTGNPSTKTRRRITLVVIALALIGITIPIVKNRHVFRRFPKRFETVAAGILYRSAQPNTRQIKNLMDEHDIRTLLIARENGGKRVPDEIEFARDHGLNVVNIPIKSQQPVPDEQVAEFFRCVDDPQNHPILIHCAAGRHRTGYLCALYRIERQGWSVEQAIEEMLSFRFNTIRQAKMLEQLKQHKPARSTTTSSADAEKPGARKTP